MADFVSEIAIFHISLLMFVSVVYLSFWLYFFVVYEAIHTAQTVGYYILFGVCGTNLFVLGPLALCVLRKGITTKPTVFRAIICSYILLGLLSLCPTPLLSNFTDGESTKQYIHDFFIEYGRPPYLMDHIQKAHQCCGYFDYTDYYLRPLESKDTFNEPVPKSCCSELVEDCEKSPTIYKQGCFVHPGSNKPKGWAQPFQGTGFLSVLLIPLALPLFQLLPICFLHDAIQILSHKRTKQLQEIELQVIVGETQQQQSHLSRKNRTIRTSDNRHHIRHSAVSVDGGEVHDIGDAVSSIVGIRVETMAESNKPPATEDTVSDLQVQTSGNYQSEKRSSKNSNHTAARNSGAHPVTVVEKIIRKEDREPSTAAELYLNVPINNGNGGHNSRTELLRVPGPHDTPTSYVYHPPEQEDDRNHHHHFDERSNYERDHPHGLNHHHDHHGQGPHEHHHHHDNIHEHHHDNIHEHHHDNIHEHHHHDIHEHHVGPHAHLDHHHEHDHHHHYSGSALHHHHGHAHHNSHNHHDHSHEEDHHHHHH
ncbi:hypothetical protein Ocin01_15275 [Orchesella cincta]|uniref:Uncharacterized protein n=1 Tax=Orchesella cincta TaxID=48709 RepID=A0A1D2MEL3_ORCCI|nr:hypothetical protein Ocin01_15275 [Orchesella cincta]